ncbi:MAG: hypothetical protein KBD56_06145 [Candidatus Eisenbacteria bacterium]|nr:hypothetical protein [Candidatus Eisenbacteria bacterium]
MRLVTLLAVCAILGFATAYAAVPVTSDIVPEKVVTDNIRPHDPLADAGGETFADAVDMVALPFHDEDDLWNYTNDIDFGYGTSPDVVYSYTPTADFCVTVDGCLSEYDQMMWVVDEGMNIIAWNDDGAACGTTASQISWLYVLTGVKYYYVLDGYGGSAGPYTLDVFQRDCPPPVECPPGAIQEGENCAAEYNDVYNGGCNSTPNIFSNVNCAPSTIFICGTTFNYYYGTSARRDTDWYQLVDLPTLGALQIHATAYYESSGSLYYIQIAEPCTATIPYGIHIGSRELGELDEIMDPALGRWAIFMSKNYYDGTWYECTDGLGWPYLLTIDGYTCGVTPNASETWGGVKSLFK